MNLTNVIPDIVNNHISFLFPDKKHAKKVSKIYDGLRKLLNGNFEKYYFNENKVDKILDNKLTDIEFQKILSSLNEKQEIRKLNGVYYTPRDVTSFIINNCLNFDFLKFSNEICLLSDKFDLSKFSGNDLNILNFNILNKTLFDPTCGSGEFLFNALETKIKIAQDLRNDLNNIDYLNILNTIHGNDLNIESVEITKIRLFFEMLRHLNDPHLYIKVADILNNNFHNKDFLNFNIDDFDKYDVVIGNPPFVEDSKTSLNHIIKYGNIYANVLHNSVDLLKDNGILGFIIPISYVSTPRMSKIRYYVEQNTKNQLILNYSDRPDCLFNSVHQKLTIIFANKGKSKHKLFTSGYKYWYKSERKDLFIDSKLIESQPLSTSFYSKINNKIELNIFKKIFTTTRFNLLDLSIQNGRNKIFLNMRVGFWIKAFSFNPGSKEYKPFGYEDKIFDFIYCILNSSLFFIYWVIVSDCWHITSKELKHFYIPENFEYNKTYTDLSKKLEKELEKTKEYIGSKQTVYEYKHKNCKFIIDLIDDELAKIYDLTSSELKYVKNFAIKYRESRGN